jgi:hypothetical protein
MMDLCVGERFALAVIPTTEKIEVPLSRRPCCSFSLYSPMISNQFSPGHWLLTRFLVSGHSPLQTGIIIIKLKVRECRPVSSEEVRISEHVHTLQSKSNWPSAETSNL